MPAAVFIACVLQNFISNSFFLKKTIHSITITSSLMAAASRILRAAAANAAASRDPALIGALPNRRRPFHVPTCRERATPLAG